MTVYIYVHIFTCLNACLFDVFVLGHGFGDGEGASNVSRVSQTTG